ncbi:hypothetical protein U5801_23100 [Lamprobacter modestohalophilus]|uniref:hypothetical protein n=1 Tax=Lamprobacter modestohalophilus TaxID=1064514 RepID=UPI002ADEDC5A|nr:hypothetical protein [Lamprobacter modestohalophilus]MEA1052674.1 hypothetical protein [Lamprobacter modestohalophilus]
MALHRQHPSHSAVKGSRTLAGTTLRFGGGGGGGGEESGGAGGTRTYWWDYAKGQRQEVLVGEAPYETLRQVHASEAEAKAAAATRQNEGKRSEARLSFTLPGDPRLMAEGRITVTLRDQIPSDWRITRAEHRINAGGWTTSCECELYTEELESVV